jgi:hypothetical protein
MNTVIFYTVNAVFKFAKKEVKERFICKISEYDLDEVSQFLVLISTDSDETILSSEGHMRLLKISSPTLPRLMTW